MLRGPAQLAEANLNLISSTYAAMIQCAPSTSLRNLRILAEPEEPWYYARSFAAGAYGVHPGDGQECGSMRKRRR